MKGKRDPADDAGRLIDDDQNMPSGHGALDCAVQSSILAPIYPQTDERQGTLRAVLLERLTSVHRPPTPPRRIPLASTDEQKIPGRQNKRDRRRPVMYQTTSSSLECTSMSFVRRPQATLIRRALFQLHLWMGLVVAAYVCVIGVTGAALVFRPEMQRATFTEIFDPHRPPGRADAPISAIVGSLQGTYPLYRIVGIDYPTARRGTYLSYLTKGSTLVTAFSDPVSGEVIGEMPKTSWITQLQDLHFDLLGGTTGRVVNGIAAFALVLMFATGLVVWWPGIARWTRALVVDFSKPWPRINWELHGAVGFWLFALLMLWAVSGVEFAFPRQFRKAVNAVLPLTVARTPESTPRPGPTLRADALPELVATARQLVPGARMGRIVMPSTPKAPIQLLLAYKDHGDFDRSDEVMLYFDQYSGTLIARQDTALVAMSAGDEVMKWMGPLHIGSFGGPGVKILWSVLALSFPVLAITGTIMWWRRVVRRAVIGESS
jgi:uncharacterized iron-regulated membrane protein